jgi:hypothetical protein
MRLSALHPAKVVWTFISSYGVVWLVLVVSSGSFRSQQSNQVRLSELSSPLSHNGKMKSGGGNIISLHFPQEAFSPSSPIWQEYLSALHNPLFQREFFTDAVVVQSISTKTGTAVATQPTTILMAPLSSVQATTLSLQDETRITTKYLQTLNKTAEGVLREMENFVLSTPRGTTIETFVLISSKGIYTDFPLYRLVARYFNETTSENAPFHFRVICHEIRISSNSKGYLVSDSGGFRLVKPIKDLPFSYFQLADSILSAFVVVPYYSRATCQTTYSTIQSLERERQTFMSFMGCVRPKGKFRRKVRYNGAGFIQRKILKKAMEEEEDVVFVDTCDEQNRNRTISAPALELYRKSVFCPVPGGDSVASIRIIDAISALCIPIVTNGALALPFVDDIPWKNMAFYHEIRSLLNATVLLQRLRCLPKQRILFMRRMIAKHMGKVLWNWNNVTVLCPGNRGRSIDQDPAYLLQKQLSAIPRVPAMSIFAMELGMELPHCDHV